MKQRYKLLIVDDEVSFSRLLQYDLQDDYELDLSSDGTEAVNKVQKTLYDLILLDIKLPRMDGTEVLKILKESTPSTPVIMISGQGDISTAVKCMKLGADDYVQKPHDINELLNKIEHALERKKLLIDNMLMKSELSRKAGPSEIIGESKVLRNVIESALKVAQSDSIVLIEGASGTGKELIANLIHKNSPRVNRPFVVLNCASIPDSLLESELFGHEKGAFTNAYSTKQGLVEIAHGGSLFLDEVGDISPAIQPKLLRFVETGNFRRVGGVNELQVDARIISATNKNLQEEVHSGRFREDLLYRLNVFTISIPLLQDRKEDLPLLADHFLKTKAKSKTMKTLSPEAAEILLHHDWPGNVRELEHVLEGALIMSHGDVIQPQDLFLSPRPIQVHTQPVPVIADGSDNGTNGILPLEEIEKRQIEAALKHFKWNRTKTAQTLGISQKTLYLKIKRYGIQAQNPR